MRGRLRRGGGNGDRRVIARARARRGAILVVAMALVAATGAIGLAIASRASRDDARTSAARDRAEAQRLARGARGDVEEMLLADDAEVDGRTDAWNEGLFFTGEDFEVQVAIEDESARFPLDRLYPEGRLDLDARDAFVRLLAALDLPERYADVAIDYVDEDDEPFPQGAEKDAYERAARAAPPGFTPPLRRPPNRPFRAPEEVLDFPGLASEDAARLVAVVTTHAGGRVNVNTASPVVLRALSPRIDEDLANAIASRARRVPFRSLEELVAVPGMPEGLGEELKPWLSVAAGAFRVRITARVRDAVAHLEYVVLRRGGRIETIYFRG